MLLYHTVLGRVTLIVSFIQDDSHVYVCMACTAHAQIAFLREAIIDRSSSPRRHCPGYLPSIEPSRSSEGAARLLSGMHPSPRGR